MLLFKGNITNLK